MTQKPICIGVLTYFSKSSNWTRLPDLAPPKPEILKRIAFKHKESEAVLVADAYSGNRIKTSIEMFLQSSAGNKISEVKVDGMTLQIGGGANVIVYVGHNGLMDFDLEKPSAPVDSGERDAVILACYSKRYFKGLIKDSGTAPLLWTTN